MAGTLREAFKKLVIEALNENAVTTSSPNPEEGMVTKVEQDSNSLPTGSYEVQTGSSLYTEVGAPIVLTKGQQVVVITAGGRKVAVPR